VAWSPSLNFAKESTEEHETELRVIMRNSQFLRFFREFQWIEWLEPLSLSTVCILKKIDER